VSALIETEREAIVKEVLRNKDVSPWFYGNSFAECFEQLREWESIDFEHGCWKTLEIKETKDVWAIKQAYRKLVKIAHPDMGGSDEAFKKLNQAYNDAMKEATG
jgi:hypothetical protein